MLYEILSNYLMSDTVKYLTPEKPFFSEKYLMVRALENRILSDEEVKQLPLISTSNPHYKEWELRQKTLARFISYFSAKKQPQEVLDIGCGNGWFTNKIAEVSKKNKVIGLDVNSLELKQAVRIFQKENLLFYYADLFEIDKEFSERFTLITLNACVQYFEDFEKLMNKLTTFLKPNGEIHILDSPFYKPKDILAAKQRTVVYFKKMGVPEMSDFYFHHSTNLIKNFETCYSPKTGILSKIFFKKDSPFLWMRYRKS